MKSSAKLQAVVAVALALLLGTSWALFGIPLRVRWLVARGAPPSPAAPSAAASEALRALGIPAKGTLSGILGDESSSRSRKSWVASVLLRSPFFAQAEVEGMLASPRRTVARAAAYALMEGDADGVPFEEAAVTPARSPRQVRSRNAPATEWEPGPAVPVLLDWVADRTDPEARFAARLLGKVPVGDARVKEALLRVVDEVPAIFAKDAPVDMVRRKLLVTEAMQSLLPWAAGDAEVVARVSKMVGWIESSGLSAEAPDLEGYGMELFAAVRGRGVDPALLAVLARSPTVITRQKLAGALENIPGKESTGILRDLLADESPHVRRGAVLTLIRRKDPLVLELAPYLVEDASPLIRVDAVRAFGDLVGVAPELCRSMVPLLVSCLEDPWPGPRADTGSTFAGVTEGARAEVIERAAVSLHRVTGSSPGFEKEALLDWKKRSEIARALAADPGKRAAVVAEWRKTVPDRPAKERVPHLVRRLEDRDPDNVVRAMRELHRLTGDGTGFPPEALKTPGDDTEARNAVRAARKGSGWPALLERWRKRAAD